MMWDLSGGKSPMSQYQMPRQPSPSFPVPHNGAPPGSTHPVGSSYHSVPNFPASYISPAPEPYDQPRSHHIQYAQPQTIIVSKRHHSSQTHHHKHHRSHSRSPQITYATSQQPVHHAPPPVVIPYYPSHKPLHQTFQASAPIPHYTAHKQSYQSAHATVPFQSPDFNYSKCTGRRKALCIGINYIGQKNELRGCINDARHVRDFLIQKQGYKIEDIVILTDDAKNPRKLPTRKNMLDAMKWLVRSAKTNDSLFFHYSGHGAQTPDKDGDETDGFDEVIFPVDFKTNGHILDDTMHDIMVKPLPTGCRLTALFDSCHSGTVLDLPFIYSSHGRLKGNQVSRSALARKATPADVISWSGCKDGQTSADTFEGGVAVGAMSYAFITALTRKHDQSYDELLRSIRLILQPRFSQKPQLGSSHHIDTSLRFII